MITTLFLFRHFAAQVYSCLFRIDVGAFDILINLCEHRMKISPAILMCVIYNERMLNFLSELYFDGIQNSNVTPNVIDCSVNRFRLIDIPEGCCRLSEAGGVYHKYMRNLKKGRWLHISVCLVSIPGKNSFISLPFKVCRCYLGHGICLLSKIYYYLSYIEIALLFDKI